MDEKRIVELIDDPTFTTGFNVFGYSSVEDGRKIVMKMDYNQKASKSNRNIWYMAQWWTPYSLVSSTYRFDQEKHIYETPSRRIETNPQDQGYLKIDLLGSEEYFGEPRKTMSQSWPHALIEQTFSNPVKLLDLEALIINLDVTIDRCDDKNGDKYDPNLHAAQLLWYFTLTNNVCEDADFNQYGMNGDFLWFGVPIFDSRYPYLAQSAFIDQGSPGTSNKLIYSIDSRNYLSDKIVFGKTYHIHLNILPYLKEAYHYAINHQVLVNCQYENMVINYLNFGWELPGMFDVSATIRNMSAKAFKK